MSSASRDHHNYAGFVHFEPRGTAQQVRVDVDLTEMLTTCPIRQLETILSGMGTIIDYHRMKSYPDVQTAITNAGDPTDLTTDIVGGVAISAEKPERAWDWLVEHRWPDVLGRVHDKAQATSSGWSNGGRADPITGLSTPEGVEWSFRRILDTKGVRGAAISARVPGWLPHLLRGLAVIVPDVTAYQSTDGLSVVDIAPYVLGSSAADPLIDVGRARLYRRAGFSPAEARRSELSQQSPPPTSEALRTMGALR